MSSPLKAVVDHHVDRPGVEAERSVQLTGTNRLIGLIALIANALRANRRFVAPLTPSEGQHDRDPLKPRTSRQTGVCADATNLRFAPTRQTCGLRRPSCNGAAHGRSRVARPCPSPAWWL